MVKIISMYLPQFHCIPENDEFWGKGFTDWITVKKAKSLFAGHEQPKVPMGKNYYDLSEEKNVEWQSKIAHEYGIYAFGVYHYWFNNEKNLLTKPAEYMRDSDSMETKYFFTWDNCNWKRSWSNVSGNDWSLTADQDVDKAGPSILVSYILGGEGDWHNHYNYVKTHFASKNYMKKDNKPIFAIINYDPEIEKMSQCWNRWAIEDGFDGVFFIYKYQLFRSFPESIHLYNYEPHFSAWGNINTWTRIKNIVIRKLKLEKSIYLYDYDHVWKSLLKNARTCDNPNLYHGAFVSYDDSPRRGMNRSRILTGGTPEKFGNYLKELLTISETQRKEYVFLTAWNEWSEGAYLEPDERDGYKYLESVKEAVNTVSNQCRMK